MDWDEPYWEPDVTDDYQPTTHPNPMMMGVNVNRKIKYQHSGNDCWYHPTYCGRWVPVSGQGMEIYPRSLNTDYLEGYAGRLKFKKGDIVRLKTGSAPIRVEKAVGNYFTGEYVSSGTRVVARPITDIVLHEDYNNMATQKETTMTNTNTLYEIKVTEFGDITPGGIHTVKTLYGHYLATNSSGQWVMEEKDTGTIHTVDKKDVQEVLPYTIGVQFLDGGVGKTYSYFSDKGKFSVGQTFILNNSLVTIVEIDTKSKSATKDFTPTVEIMTREVD